MHLIYHYASGNEVEKLKTELDKDRNIVNMQSADIGCAPLHLAAEQGNKEAVELLLQYGADIYAGDKENQTAFYLAISCLSRAKEQEKIDKYFKILELLLKHEVAIRLEFPQKYPSKHLWLRERKSGINTFTPESRLKARPELQKRLEQLIEDYKADYDKKKPRPVKAAPTQPAVIQDRYSVEADMASKENNKQHINRATEGPSASSGIVNAFLSWFNADADQSVKQPLLDKTANNGYESSKKDI